MGVLTDEQKRDFDELGFVTLRGFYSTDEITRWGVTGTPAAPTTRFARLLSSVRAQLTLSERRNGWSNVSSRPG